MIPSILDRFLIDAAHARLNLTWSSRMDNAMREVEASGEPAAPPEPPPRRGPGKPSKAHHYCPVTGFNHVWAPLGKEQAQCMECSRKVVRSLIAGRSVRSRKHKRSAIVLAYLQSVKPCTQENGHQWQRDGKSSNGKFRAKCGHCKTTTERLPDV